MHVASMTLVVVVVVGVVAVTVTVVVFAMALAMRVALMTFVVVVIVVRVIVIFARHWPCVSLVFKSPVRSGFFPFLGKTKTEPVLVVLRLGMQPDRTH